ncbi:hypothetical protein SAMN06298216_1519 [Spirosomataceae bacterium TFI 002]|nr:hypothetical protein SAMN06298216_1519 [Spirosomataceae bacterium TFI 002]
MKTTCNIILIAITSLLISSCGKLNVTPKEDDAKSGSKVTGTMKAKLDGKDWEAKKVSFGGIFALIQANGYIDDDNFISLEFDDSKLKVGTTYILGKDKPEGEIHSLVYRTSAITYFATSGSFKITKYTRGKNIEGEINAKLYDFEKMKEIPLDNCTFSMSYN